MREDREEGLGRQKQAAQMHLVEDIGELQGQSVMVLQQEGAGKLHSQESGVCFRPS